jgi:hypothetical protein
MTLPALPSPSVNGYARQLSLLPILWKSRCDSDPVLASCKTCPPAPSSAVHPKRPLIACNPKSCFHVREGTCADVFGKLRFTSMTRPKSILLRNLRYMIDGMNLTSDVHLLNSNA